MIINKILLLIFITLYYISISFNQEVKASDNFDIVSCEDAFGRVAMRAAQAAGARMARRYFDGEIPDIKDCYFGFPEGSDGFLSVIAKVKEEIKIITIEPHLDIKCLDVYFGEYPGLDSSVFSFDHKGIYSIDCRLLYSLKN